MMKKIMIIEDDISIRDSLSELLTEEGFSVFIAEHGQHALDLLSQDIQPNLILLDLSMPVMDGKTFLKEVSNQFPSTNGLPIIIMTAAGHGDIPRDYDKSRILRKPLDIDILMSKIDEYINP